MPGVIQCVPVISNGDYKASCVMGFLNLRTENYTETQLTTIQAKFDSLFTPLWLAYGASDSHYLGCDVFDLNSTTSGSVLYNTFTPVAGVMGQSMGAQVSILISHKIPERYKGGRPRNYLPYVGNVVAYNGDTLLDEHVAVVQAKWDLLVSTFDFPTLEDPFAQAFGAIRGRRHPATASFEPTVVSVVQDRFATQRRRLRKVNRHR